MGRLPREPPYRPAGLLARLPAGEQLWTGASAQGRQYGASPCQRSVVLPQGEPRFLGAERPTSDRCRARYVGVAISAAARGAACGRGAAVRGPTRALGV